MRSSVACSSDNSASDNTFSGWCIGKHESQHIWPSTSKLFANFLLSQLKLMVSRVSELEAKPFR